MKIICPDCGNRCTSERYTWKRKTDNAREVRNSYRCQVCALNNPDKTSFSVREVKLDEALIEYMKNLDLAPTLSNDNNDSDSQADQIKKELKRIENQREKYQRAWASDLITDDEFKSRMDESRYRYNELQEQLKDLKDENYSDYDIKRLRELAEQFNRNFSELTQEERRAFIQTFIEHIKLDVVERTKGKAYRNQVIKIASINLY